MSKRDRSDSRRRDRRRSKNDDDEDDRKRSKNDDDDDRKGSRNTKERERSGGRDTKKEEKTSLELKPGQKIRIQGLQKNPEKNGSLGTLVEYNAAKERWVVEFASSATNNFKAENLECVDDGFGVDDNEEIPTAKVYITNLSADTEVQDLIDLFGGIGALEREAQRTSKGGAKGFRDEWPYAAKVYKPGKAGGDGCVEYMDKFAAKASITAFNGYRLKGSKIGVAYAGLGKQYAKVELTLPWAEREGNYM